MDEPRHEDFDGQVPTAPTITGRPTVRRRRIPSDVRQMIVDAIIDGRCNGAGAARLYGVSEATVHRLLKTQQQIDPGQLAAARRSIVRSGWGCTLGEKRFTDCDRAARRALSLIQQREVVERLYAGSDLATDLAREFCVHKSTISRIFRVARAQDPCRSLPGRNVEEWQRRVEVGVAKAMAGGSHPGSRAKLSSQQKQAIVKEAGSAGETFTSIARRYGVNRRTISRIVLTRRVSREPDNALSLEKIFGDLLENSSLRPPSDN